MLPRILGAQPEGVAVSPSQLVWTHALCLTVMVVVGCGGDGTTDPLDQPPNPTIVDVAITPRSRELITGDTASFVAVGRRSDGTTQGVTATFTADGGTVSSSGSYVAGQQAGSFHVVAALVVDGKALADTASILLTEPVASNTVANPSALADGERAAEERDGVHRTQRAGDGSGRVLHRSGDGGAGMEDDERVRVPVARTRRRSTFYSEGPAQASAEWAPGKHTLYILTGGGYLVGTSHGGAGSRTGARCRRGRSS